MLLYRWSFFSCLVDRASPVQIGVLLSADTFRRGLRDCDRHCRVRLVERETEITGRCAPRPPVAGGLGPYRCAEVDCFFGPARAVLFCFECRCCVVLLVNNAKVLG